MNCMSFNQIRGYIQVVGYNAPLKEHIEDPGHSA